MGCYSTSSADQTENLGMRLAKALRPGNVIAFTGGLGAGKTTFCRGIAKGLGVTDPVSSPTFAIVNYYNGPLPFAHFDAYRISGGDDLETAGFYEYLDKGAVIAVEWSENIVQYLEGDIIKVDIAQISENERKITIEGADFV